MLEAVIDDSQEDFTYPGGHFQDDFTNLIGSDWLDSEKFFLQYCRYPRRDTRESTTVKNMVLT